LKHVFIAKYSLTCRSVGGKKDVKRTSAVALRRIAVENAEGLIFVRRRCCGSGAFHGSRMRLRRLAGMDVLKFGVALGATGLLMQLMGGMGHGCSLLKHRNKSDAGNKTAAGKAAIVLNNVKWLPPISFESRRSAYFRLLGDIGKTIDAFNAGNAQGSAMTDLFRLQITVVPGGVLLDILGVRCGFVRLEFRHGGSPQK
jgi:hypothetical protein